MKAFGGYMGKNYLGAFSPKIIPVLWIIKTAASTQLLEGRQHSQTAHLRTLLICVTF